MIRTNTTDALTTTAAILFVIALFTGNDSTGLDWLIRAACIYPFTHLAWRAHRHRQHQ
jgi:hypothetical protein